MIKINTDKIIFMMAVENLNLILFFLDRSKLLDCWPVFSFKPDEIFLKCIFLKCLLFFYLCSFLITVYVTDTIENMLHAFLLLFSHYSLCKFYLSSKCILFKKKTNTFFRLNKNEGKNYFLSTML
jgi:hypothetical protein